MVPDESARLREALQECEARFHNVIQRAADGIVIVGGDRRVRFANSAAERLFGRSAAELVGGEFGLALLAGDTLEMDVVRPDGEPVVAEIRAGDTTWEGGPAQVISLRDVTDRRRAEAEQAARERAERAVGRSRFLAEAGDVLDSSLDPEVMLGALARFVVPHLADWCVVDLVEGGGARRVAFAHGDPEKLPLLRELQRGWPPAADAPVLGDGAAELHPRVDAAALRALPVGNAPAELLRRLGLVSALAVPLRGREQRLGAITLACGEHPFDEDDLALAEEVASRAGRALENARLYEAALAASRAKSDFLAVMSHELRTPLNAILGYTDLLLSGVTGEVDDRQGRQLRRVRTSATHLLELIEEVLAYAQMEAGREQPRPGPFRLGALVDEAVAIAEPLAREKGLELRVEVPDPDAELFTDLAKLRRVTLNLLTNAAKFTARGAVTLRAAVEGDQAVIAVADTGPGIAPELLELVFEPFWQAEQSLTRQVGGTGLGLSVARGLAEMLGGTVAAGSEPGGGSRFTVRVPARLPL